MRISRRLHYVNAWLVIKGFKSLSKKMKGKAVKMIKKIFVGALLLAAVDAQAQSCGSVLNTPLIVGMDFCTGTLSTGNWETYANGVLSGFDVAVACQLATYLGYTGVQFVYINTNGGANPENIYNAIQAGTVAVGISHLQFLLSDPFWSCLC